MNAETVLQNKIRVALSDIAVTFRINVGTFKAGDRYISTGAPKGFSDLFGFRRKDGKTFDSAPEMAVAAMLVHNQIRCKPQYSIGKYRVDFYLPSLNVALEIDGEQHRPSYDAERDLRIRAEIQNYDFEILHIPVFYVQSNLASIPENIFTAAKKARKIRSSHGKNEAYHASLEIIQLRDIWNQSPKPDTSRDVK